MAKVSVEDLAFNVLEQAVSPYVLAKKYDVLLALEQHGVSLVHALAVAADKGKHQQAEWLLARGVRPNARVLRFAICKGVQMTNRIMPHVTLRPEHADVAAATFQQALLDRIIQSGTLPTVNAFKFVGMYARDTNANETVRLLMVRGEPWRFGTQALLYVIHLATSQQIVNTIAVAPARFNREKLLARALRCCHEAGALEIARYGFGAKVTDRVAILAFGAKKISHLQNNPLHKVAEHLINLWLETNSAPLSAGAVTRVVRHLTLDHMSRTASCDLECGRNEKLVKIVERVIALSDPSHRPHILRDAMLNFLVDREESVEAKGNHRNLHMWPSRYEDFQRFKGWFENFLQTEIDAAAQSTAEFDSGQSIGGL